MECLLCVAPCVRYRGYHNRESLVGKSVGRERKFKCPDEISVANVGCDGEHHSKGTSPNLGMLPSCFTNPLAKAHTFSSFRIFLMCFFFFKETFKKI